MAELTTIIPIAGGKGGVGKTFVTANLAVALASRGFRTLAVDLDLGNSNLHSLLGLENRYPGVGEYLRGTVKCSPHELIVETSLPGLGFIPGDGRMPFMANITYNKKLALMSTLVFVKNLVWRAIDQNLRRDASMKQRLNDMYKQSVRDPVFTVESFRSELAETDPEAAEKVDAICRRIRPRFVYNMVENLQVTEIFANIDQTFAEVLSIECDHLGLIPYDARVRQSLKQPGIFQLKNLESAAAVTIDRLAHRVVNLWDTPLVGSAEVLAEYARTVLPNGEA